jgi:predicted glycosyltransferase
MIRQRTDDRVKHMALEQYGQPDQCTKRVWIDLDNSPHVPFFVPIIDALEEAGVEVLLTARNMYQVCDLIDYFGLQCRVIGGHCGKHTLLKVAYNCARALKLLPIALRGNVNLALSHGSRAQVLACKLLGIPSMMMHDYEHSTKTGFVEADWILTPDVIPTNAMSRRSDRVLKYPGLKEDVYVPRFRPDPQLLRNLGLSPDHVIVTLRPPASDSHYHRPESDVLFAATLHFLAQEPLVRMIVMPRNARQRECLRAAWAALVSSGELIIPEGPINGLNVIWFSDLVVGGGGTMNREAAALGVPVYSIFRGKLGAVDQYLVAEGRLTLIETASDIRTKIHVGKWNRPPTPGHRYSPALQSIVGTILDTVMASRPAQVVS